MNIKRAKEEIEHTVKAYLAKDALGEYAIPSIRQRPILLMGPPGIGKTQIMEQAARECGVQQAVDRIAAPAGSEDATLMMARVQARGGLASYMIFGTELSAGHHNEKFDFDESVMAVAVETLARVALNFPWQRGV